MVNVSTVTNNTLRDVLNAHGNTAPNATGAIGEHSEGVSKHGIDDTSEFFNDLGNMATYQAQTVLEWLGY